MQVIGLVWTLLRQGPGPDGKAAAQKVIVVTPVSAAPHCNSPEPHRSSLRSVSTSLLVLLLPSSPCPAYPHAGCAGLPGASVGQGGDQVAGIRAAVRGRAAAESRCSADRRRVPGELCKGREMSEPNVHGREQQSRVCRAATRATSSLLVVAVRQPSSLAQQPQQPQRSLDLQRRVELSEQHTHPRCPRPPLCTSLHLPAGARFELPAVGFAGHLIRDHPQVCQGAQGQLRPAHLR